MLHWQFDEARSLLLAIIEEHDGELLASSTIAERWSIVADAATCLAGIAYCEGRFQEALSWAQQAVLRGSLPPLSAHLIAARAHRRLGEAELEASKLGIVMSAAEDLGTRVVAMVELCDLSRNGDETTS